MEASNLILSIDEGPKKGETFDRWPGSFIRIGRVVRGNTLAIKDPRISQKHLIVEFHPEISRWAVTDLGSSNGTTVNGVVISPNAAFALANGDIIEIGESTLMSVKIYAPSSVSEPRTRRGRRAAAAVSSPIEEEAKEGKVVEPAEHGEKGESQGKVCPESANVDYAVQRKPVEGKRRMPTRASAKYCSARDPNLLEVVDAKENEKKPNKNYQVGRAQRKKGIISVAASKSDKALDPVVEEDIRSSARAIELSARALKEKNKEREIEHEEVEGPTKNGRKGMGRLKSGIEPTRILRKDASLGPVSMKEKRGRVTKALSMASPARFLIMKAAEHGEKVESQGKVCPESAHVDYAVQRMPMEGKRRMPRRASAKSCSASVPKLLEVVDAKENEEKPTKHYQVGRAQRKNGIISVGASKSDKALDPVLEEDIRSSTRAFELSAQALKEKNVERETEHEEVEGPTKNGQKGMGRLKSGVEPTSILKKDASLGHVAMKEKRGRDVKAVSMASSVRVLIMKDKEVETSEKIEDLHLLPKEELIRGIPNTTSKYREDRMINCHATPFETRVERALNSGIAETSSSLET